jgi:ABC-type oligopeptide transport system substrate-binding subunit
MTTNKITAAILLLGFAALPLTNADAATRHHARPAVQQQQPVYEGRNATTYFDPAAADNGATAIELQEEGNARGEHGR